MDNCAVECLAVRQSLAFSFLNHYRSGVSQGKTRSVGLSCHLCHTDWDWDCTGKCFWESIAIGPSASEGRGKMLGWNKRCYCPSEGVWRLPTSNSSSCAAVSFLGREIMMLLSTACDDTD